MSPKTQDPRPALSLLKRALVRVKERLRNISNGPRRSLCSNQKHERDFPHCTVHMPSAPPATTCHATRDLRLYSRELIWVWPCSLAGRERLTICLRKAIREALGGLRSSLLSFTSAASGVVASPSSLRSTVCKAESASSGFVISTGDSHTTWIIWPGYKTAKKKKKKKKTFPKPCFIKRGPDSSLDHLGAVGLNL